MIRSLYTAGSGVLSGQRQIDTIANNVANINTVGFKESRMNFNDVFYANLQQNKNHESTNRLSNPGIQIGHGVMPNSVTKKLTQGPIINTSNPFDLAIEGPGFFGIYIDGQMHLTRHGNFNVDSHGNLVNSQGHIVAGQYPNLLEYTDISISTNGTITGSSNAGEVGEIGIIHVFGVTNPSGLQKEGENIFSVTENSGQATPVNSVVRQGALEGSNVNLADQIANLMLSQRALEASAKLIHSTDEMMSQANNLRR